MATPVNSESHTFARQSRYSKRFSWRYSTPINESSLVNKYVHSSEIRKTRIMPAPPSIRIPTRSLMRDVGPANVDGSNSRMCVENGAVSCSYHRLSGTSSFYCSYRSRFLKWHLVGCRRGSVDMWVRSRKNKIKDKYIP
jgi:hypothetical protein